MITRHKIGIDGENLVCQFLWQQGFKLLTRRFKCRSGEIDVIAERDNFVYLVEVKTSLKKGHEAVLSTRQRCRLWQAGIVYCKENSLEFPTGLLVALANLHEMSVSCELWNFSDLSW